MDHAPGVRHAVEAERSLAQVERAIDPREDEVAGHGPFEPESDEADPDLALRIEEAPADRVPFVVAKLDDVAVGDLAADAIDRAGEHPGVTEPDRARAP